MALLTCRMSLHPVSAMLTLLALGLLMGGRDMKNIWRRVAKLDDAADSVINLLDEHELEIHELSELYALANELRDAIQAIR
mgnify:CR=1 FL=1